MNTVVASGGLARISRLGLGTWAMGGSYENGWGPVNDRESVDAIRSSGSFGISWLDTAPAYGQGHAEVVVGRAIRDIENRPLVFTKCGRVWDNSGSGKVWTDLRPESIRAECAASLERLAIDTIDGYQIHRPDAAGNIPLEESWAELARLADEGKVRWIGLCNVTPAQYLACQAVRHVDTVQLGLSLFRPADSHLIAECQQNGTLVFAFSPLGSGVLSGTFDRTKLSEDDWRTRSPRLAGSVLKAKLERVERLRSIAAAKNCAVAELAIAWVLHQQGISASIVGARRPSQIRDWAPAAQRLLSTADLDELDGLRLDE